MTKTYRCVSLLLLAVLCGCESTTDGAGSELTMGFRHVGISSKADAAATLPALNAVLAFPTAIFIDRSGEIRCIHTGFDGPGTGEHYAALAADMTSFIDELLAEPASGNQPQSGVTHAIV